MEYYVTLDDASIQTLKDLNKPSGNINITDTEITDVAKYATAQVVDENLVAGNIKKDVEILGVTGEFEGEGDASDFSIVNVTFVNSLNTPVFVQCASFIDDDEHSYYASRSGVTVNSNITLTVPVILYKGYAEVVAVDMNNDNLGLSGDNYDDEFGFITGAGTITIEELK